jgi:recombination protein RecR
MADPIQRLVQQLARLPGLGEKTATRLAFHMLRAPKQQVRDLAQALVDAVDRLRLCSLCANVTEDDPCGLCTDTRRDADLVCVVASPSDLIAIERGGHYRGRYHVLHGLLSPLEGIGPDDLRIKELLARLKEIDELILATSPNVEGEATALYLARQIKPLGIKVSRIATGLPIGGELEYSDQATIARALAHRATL